MKSSIKLIYRISQINGLISFQINKDRGFVEETKKSFCHFVIFGAFIQTLSFLASHHLYLSLQSTLYNESVRVFVIKWELSFLFFKSLISFASNLMYHKDTVALINEMILFEKVLEQSSPPLRTFCDYILVKQYVVRCVAFIIQASISLSSFLFFEYKISDLGDNLSWTVTIFNHVTALILTSTFFYGGLIINSRFLRILNDNLELYISSTRNGKIVDPVASIQEAIFQLDQFSIFFKKFSSLTDKLFHIYGLQILLALMASAGFTLSSVRMLH